MRIDITPNNRMKGYYTVVPHGPIDSDTHHEFKEDLKPIMNASTKGIVFNMKDVDYISSAGLGALFSIEKSMSQHNALLAFCNLQPQIQKLIDGVRMLPKNILFKSLEEADRYFDALIKEELERQKNKPAKP